MFGCVCFFHFFFYYQSVIDTFLYLVADSSLPPPSLLQVSPEQCCAFYSRSAAEQRLKHAGYGDKFLSALEVRASQA